MILHAHSKKNGILFYSTKLPVLGTETYYDNNGHIQTERVFSKPAEFLYSLELLKEYKQFHVSKLSTFIFIIFVFLISFLAYTLSQNFGFLMAAIHFCCLGAHEFLKLFKTIIHHKKNNSNSLSVSKFHAAEHMAIAAYNTLNKVPTLDEIKKFSRFDKYCGSQETLSNIFINIVGSLFIIIAAHIGLHYSKLIFCVWAVIFILFLLLLSIFNKHLVFLQVFTTSKPTEKELYLAIEGVRQFVLLEEDLEDENFANAANKLSAWLSTLVDNKSKEIFD